MQVKFCCQAVFQHSSSLKQTDCLSSATNLITDMYVLPTNTQEATRMEDAGGSLHTERSEGHFSMRLMAWAFRRPRCLEQYTRRQVCL